MRFPGMVISITLSVAAVLKNKLSCFESRSNSKVSISNVDRVVTVKSYPPVSTRS